MAKIITQCTTTDFKQIVEFANAHKEGTPLPQLSPKQKAALIVVSTLAKAGITPKEIYTIRRILFWDNGRWDYKFYHTPEAMRVRAKLSQPATHLLIKEHLAKIGTEKKEVTK